VLKGTGLAFVGIVLGAAGSVAAVVLGIPAGRAAVGGGGRGQGGGKLKGSGPAMPNFAGGGAGGPENVRAVVYTAANLHMVGSGRGNLPPVAIADRKGKPLLSWRVALLPYLGEWDLYRKFKLDEPWDSPHNKALLPLMPEIYACPSFKGPNRK